MSSWHSHIYLFARTSYHTWILPSSTRIAMVIIFWISTLSLQLSAYIRIYQNLMIKQKNVSGSIYIYVAFLSWTVTTSFETILISTNQNYLNPIFLCWRRRWTSPETWHQYSWKVTCILDMSIYPFWQLFIWFPSLKRLHKESSWNGHTTNLTSNSFLRTSHRRRQEVRLRG